MQKLEIIEEGWVACAAGQITAVGPAEEVREQVELINETMVIGAAGKVITPGLIDPHTHLVFGGSREDEFYLRARGADYMEIMEAGEESSAQFGQPGLLPGRVGISGDRSAALDAGAG